MPKVTVGRENSADVDIHYEDHGAGQPVVLIHGYPLSGRAWDRQVPVLLEAGHRVITYDRRGFGQPGVGYDDDTLVADLVALLEHLDLWDAVLVGHSMGTGEVTRYLGAYGSGGVAKGVLVSPIRRSSCRRSTTLTGCRKACSMGSSRVVVQRDADRVLPLDKTGRRLPGLIDDVQLVVIEGRPHAIAWTHADQVNTALLDFMPNREKVERKAAAGNGRRHRPRTRRHRRRRTAGQAWLARALGRPAAAAHTSDPNLHSKPPSQLDTIVAPRNHVSGSYTFPGVA